MDREALLDKCETPSQRSQLESAIATSASGGKCGVCRKHPVTEISAGVIVTWNADFKKLRGFPALVHLHRIFSRAHSTTTITTTYTTRDQRQHAHVQMHANTPLYVAWSHSGIRRNRVERKQRHGSVPSLLHIVECRRDAEGNGISTDCPGRGIRLCPARGAQHIYKRHARRCGAAGGPQYGARHQDSC